MKIICISGKRGTGKSLLATFLEKKGYRRLPLARALKDKCLMDFNLTEEQVNGVCKESPTQFKDADGKFLTPRDIMIRLGAFYRSIDPLYWCHKVAERIYECEIYAPGLDKFVIDDVRFLNEVKFFKEMGAKFVRLERYPELNVFKEALDDISETELDHYGDWDHLVGGHINKTPQDLERLAELLR